MERLEMRDLEIRKFGCRRNGMSLRGVGLVAVMACCVGVAGAQVLGGADVVMVGERFGRGLRGRARCRRLRFGGARCWLRGAMRRC